MHFRIVKVINSKQQQAAASAELNKMDPLYYSTLRTLAHFIKEELRCANQEYGPLIYIKDARMEGRLKKEPMNKECLKFAIKVTNGYCGDHGHDHLQKDEDAGWGLTIDGEFLSDDVLVKACLENEQLHQDTLTVATDQPSANASIGEL